VAVDMFQMFFGILILSFIVERFFEIISSVLEYIFCTKSDKRQWFIKTEIDAEEAQKFAPIKRLIFTPLGIIIGIGIVNITEISILQDTNLLTSTAPLALNVDKFLTAVVISWGTGPIHNFIDSIGKYKKYNGQQ